jgi:hypothetical protein
MTGTEQASSRYIPATEIGLFVGTDSLAGNDVPFAPDQNQVDAAQAYADNRLRSQSIEPADRNPRIFAGQRER